MDLGLGYPQVTSRWYFSLSSQLRTMAGPYVQLTGREKVMLSSQGLLGIWMQDEKGSPLHYCSGRAWKTTKDTLPVSRFLDIACRHLLAVISFPNNVRRLGAKTFGEEAYGWTCGYGPEGEGFWIPLFMPSREHPPRKTCQNQGEGMTTDSDRPHQVWLVGTWTDSHGGRNGGYTWA